MKTVSAFLLILIGAFFYLSNIGNTYETLILGFKQNFHSLYSDIVNKKYSSTYYSSELCGSGIVFDLNNIYSGDGKESIDIFFPKTGTGISTYNDYYNAYNTSLCIDELRTTFPKKFDHYNMTATGILIDKIYFGKTIYDNDDNIVHNIP